MANSEKTEKATPKRKRETRNKGQIARSAEINSAFIIIAILLAMRNFGQNAFEGITDLMRYFLQSPASFEMNERILSTLFLNLSFFFAKNLLPVIVVGAIVGLVAGFAQVGFLFTAKPLVPDFKKINPISGLKRLFSPRAFVELFKSCVKIIAISYISYSVIAGNFENMVNIINLDVWQMLVVLGSIAYEIGIKTGITLLVIAVFDYAYQRYDHNKSIMMTKKEIKDEYKQAEGDPLIKAKIKQQQMELSMNRMMQAVPNADVIITNPTRLAIALKYDQANMGAPTVIAKGQRLVAERIRALAKEHAIPIVEDKPLAQALFKSVDVDQEIPADLYKAVAEVLAFVYQLNKGLRTRKTPAPTLTR
ncbi:MAG: flagellar biosynthesis protein FlhB [Actinobacteria bacterium]|nr:flagellar biosynthesis protein FlhB [Actinomycetota bacterium]